MFPNSPLFMEKLVRTKQEEIMREIQDIQELPNKAKVKRAMWALICLLIALAWLF